MHNVKEINLMRKLSVFGKDEFKRTCDPAKHFQLKVEEDSSRILSI